MAIGSVGAATEPSAVGAIAGYAVLALGSAVAAALLFDVGVLRWRLVSTTASSERNERPPADPEPGPADPLAAPTLRLRRAA